MSASWDACCRRAWDRTLARQAGLKAGLPNSLNAQTINKVCGSGLQAVMLAAQSIKAGDNQLVIAGGFENMSLAPHLEYLLAGVKFGDATMIDHMQFDGLTCPFETWAMGCAADFIAGKFKISRAEQDRYAAAIASAGSAGMERVLLQGGSVAVEPPSSSARRKAWRRMKAFGLIPPPMAWRNSNLHSVRKEA